MNLCLQILSADGHVLASAESGQGGLSLAFDRAYQPGDRIQLTCSRPCHLWVQLDDAIGPALLYMDGGTFELPVPFGEKRDGYSPKAFAGALHALYVREALPEEAGAARNLALNPYDHHGNAALFPHVQANAETRGEAQFAARNAINGNVLNHAHGPWPYESWGIDIRQDAQIQLRFGRKVRVEWMMIHVRCDFPHDNYWVQARFEHEGGAFTAPLTKTDQGQVVRLPQPVETDWIVMKDLIMSDEPSPFPALTQWAVFGREV